MAGQVSTALHVDTHYWNRTGETMWRSFSSGLSPFRWAIVSIAGAMLLADLVGYAVARSQAERPPRPRYFPPLSRH